MKKVGHSRRDKVLALGFLSVLSVVWVLPILLVATVGELPYLHHYRFSERFIFISLVVAIGLAGLCAYDLKGFVKNWKAGNAGKTKWEIRKDNAWGLGGLIMFNVGVAAWGGNVLALGVKLLPGQDYQSIVEVAELEYTGVRLRAANLTVKNASDGQILYLSLAKRHFNYSGIQEGSTLALQGKKGVLGTYINHVEIISETQAIRSNFSMNSDASRRLPSTLGLRDHE